MTDVFRFWTNRRSPFGFNYKRETSWVSMLFTYKNISKKWWVYL